MFSVKPQRASYLVLYSTNDASARSKHVHINESVVADQINIVGDGFSNRNTTTGSFWLQNRNVAICQMT